jgi:uncharacterized membrane protein
VRAFPDKQSEKTDGEKETGRLEAFSDGVFSVAITLLVLDVKIIDVGSLANLPTDSEVWGSVFNHIPQFSAFVISFFTIGIMWLNHHKIFKHITRTDTGLILLNILLLLIIVFIPVPTALLADYLFNTSQHAAAIIYSSTFFLMAVCFNILWHYASYHGRLLAKDANQLEIESISRQYLFGPLLYLIPLALSWFNTPISALFQFFLALFFTLPGHAILSAFKRGRGKSPKQEGSEL